jgi:uncharacterized protein YjbJ (UPF0337 family)
VAARDSDPDHHFAFRLSRHLTRRWNQRRDGTVPLDQRVELGSLVMDKQRIAGATKKVTGSVKKAVGKATGDRRLVNEGRADQAEGRVRSAVGKAKDAVREITGRR